MRASIVVVSYNSAMDLPACLEALARACAPDDEVIVVDNGSIDGSAELVRRCFPWVRLICGSNEGYGGGNNRAAQHAQGEYLVVLNPDTIVQPGSIDALIEPLGHDSTIGMTTACIVHRDRPAIVNTCGNTIHVTGLTYCRGAGQPRARFSVAEDVDAVSGAAFAIRRLVFLELGGFDPQFFMYVEDTELSLRVRLAGLRCVYIPRAIVQHAYRMSYSPTKAWWLDRNRHLMLLKLLRRSTYARLIPGLILGELVTGAFLLIKGPRYWSVKPRVYSWLWQQRSAIRASRQRVNQQRRRDDRVIVAGLAYRLAFQQMVPGPIARVASALLDPVFWILRFLAQFSTARNVSMATNSIQGSRLKRIFR